MDTQSLIALLQLEPHIEGGYFRRSYQSAISSVGTAVQSRSLMSSIYYLLTEDSPTGHWHCNQSDIIHYWQHGSEISYYTISPEGDWQHTLLGPDLRAGQQLQLVVPGGYWKASHLTRGKYGLISEAVCPGFDYQDMVLAEPETMKKHFPQHWSKIQDYIKT